MKYAIHWLLHNAEVPENDDWTEHAGFYQILDEKDDYLYPHLFQIKAGLVLHPQKDLLYKTREISAAISKDGEDQVLSMRLEKWPPEIIASLDGKLKWLCTPEAVKIE